MFRPHDVELARAEEAADIATAMAHGYVRHSDLWFAEIRLLDLERTARIGLMDCYADFAESLYDFWPGFSWDQQARARQIDLVRADPRFPAIAAAIAAEFGFDIAAELDKVRDADAISTMS